MEQFWCLQESGRATNVEWDDSVDLETVFCSEHPGHQRAGKRVTDLSVVLPDRDVRLAVWTWQSELLLQNSLIDLLMSHHLTGWEIRSASARFRDSAATTPPPLWEFVLTGWGGMALPESGIRLIKDCRSCDLQVYSAPSTVCNLIDVKQWDGSDFFFIWPLPRYIFVTSRAAEVLRAAHIDSVAVQPAQELDFMSRTLSPGRLSYWMTESRARLLGTALGIA
jgi:hypothetical protein